MTRYVVNTLKLDDTVFVSSMCYWHEFMVENSLRKINSVVLAAACVFLAAKVEHYKLSVDHIISLVFEVNTSRSEEAGAWRRTVLEVELVLCDALNFDFQRTHPTHDMSEMISRPGCREPASQSSEDAQLVNQLQATAQRLYVLSLITPLFARTSATNILRTIVYMTMYYSGCSDLYNHVWIDYPLPPTDERDSIISVLIDAFAFMRKQTGVVALDELISHRRKHVRRETETISSASPLLSSDGSTPGATAL